MDGRSRQDQEAQPQDEAAPSALDGLLVDFKDLLPGDILLFQSGDQKMHQRKISAETGSPYTHAAIYLGNGEIAEANPPKVRKRRLVEDDKKGRVIGVLRTQLGFGTDRAAKLNEFIEALLENGARYDLIGALKFKKRKAKFEDDLLAILERDYGKFSTNEEMAQKRYFCSALVVACYAAAGVIDATAQLAYKAEAFSPGDLHRDDTFGWFLGYIASDPKDIPSDDPLFSSTLWRDLPEMRWWLAAS